MSESETKSFEPIFDNPLGNSPGLTINDLNRYLPAIQTIEDISINAEEMKEGLFLSEGLEGLKKLPDQSAARPQLLPSLLLAASPFFALVGGG